jgi:hypothetical protein
MDSNAYSNVDDITGAPHSTSVFELPGCTIGYNAELEQTESQPGLFSFGGVRQGSNPKPGF